MIQKVVSTSRQVQGECAQYYRIGQTYTPDHDSHPETQMWAHDYQIMQRLTDGCESVLGHDGQEKALKRAEPHVDMELNNAAHRADGLCRSPQVHQHLRHNAGCET